MREKLAKKLAGTLGLVAYRVGELRALGIQGLVVAVGGVDQLGADGRLGEPDAWRRLLVKVRGAFPCGGA